MASTPAAGCSVCLSVRHRRGGDDVFHSNFMEGLASYIQDELTGKEKKNLNYCWCCLKESCNVCYSHINITSNLL